jgi:hypothetical protein
MNSFSFFIPLGWPHFLADGLLGALGGISTVSLVRGFTARR